MTGDRRGVQGEQIDPGTLLSDCPSRQVGLTLPIPLSNRLDLMVEAAERGGMQTSRKELVAILIAEARGSAATLPHQIRRYRSMRAGAAVLHGWEAETLTLQRARRGPRPRGGER